MASTKVIKRVGDYVLIHDILQGLYRVTDGVGLSFYFDHEQKDSLINLRDDVFIDEVRVLLELSELDEEEDIHSEQ